MCPDCVAQVRLLNLGISLKRFPRRPEPTYATLQDWNLYGVKKDLGKILNMTTIWWGNAKLLPGNRIIW